MKKLILAFLFVGTIFTANAQEPRSMLLYGDFNVTSIRDSILNTTTIWDVTFGLGYQLNSHWTVGGNLSWGQDSIIKNGTTFITTTYNAYKIGPFARYSHYLCNSEIFFWYVHLDFLYTGGYSTSGGLPAYNKNSGFYTDLFPAIGINVCRGLCLNFNVGGMNYSSYQFSDQNNGTSAFNFTFGHQLNIGISKNFNMGHRMHSSHEPGEEIHRRRMEKMDDEDDAAPKPKRKERNRDEDE